MATVKQVATTKKKAKKKNNNAKYTYTTNKTTSQTIKNGVSTKRFAYTKKITTNGKTRYYYA